ncbi:hypothetical protein [Bacteroidetes bacterium endosymbiont of Geopemphigus sp.]|nr:hypothetical protein [Bacteroidetes bacterium endosymbiont of Geopemphigus sp.]
MGKIVLGILDRITRDQFGEFGAIRHFKETLCPMEVIQNENTS